MALDVVGLYADAVAMLAVGIVRGTRRHRPDRCYPVTGTPLRCGSRRPPAPLLPCRKSGCRPSQKGLRCATASVLGRDAMPSQNPFHASDAVPARPGRLILGRQMVAGAGEDLKIYSPSYPALSGGTPL